MVQRAQRQPVGHHVRAVLAVPAPNARPAGFGTSVNLRIGMPDRRGMITHVTVSRELLVIGEAAFLVCIGLLTWRLSRRRHELPSGPALLVGLPGLYLVTLPSFYDAPRWLYIPGLVLFLSSYLIQVVVWRRQRVNSTAGPSDMDGSV
jgi:hypothetical protein